MGKKVIAPSILSADFSRLGEEIAAVEEAGADWIHIDVMDGHFVPNITVGPLIVEAAKRATSLPLDVHLMIEDPDRYLDAFIDAGADYLTVHVEACGHLQRTLSYIRQRGAKAGASLNPATPLVWLEHVLADVDLVLVMSVNPGFGGQGFIPQIIDKVGALARMLAIAGRSETVLLEVDGGVKVENIGRLARQGCDVFVAGSAIFGTKDYAGTISRMRREIERAVSAGPAAID
jgi:ribulose-phosphate 3-epimerase